LGWGSDTCGSIRIPSAYNNLFGLRPTQGMVSRSGIVPLSHTQDIAGPLARSVTDLAIALDATVGADPKDAATRAIEGRVLAHFTDSLSASAFRGARIGVLLNYMSGDIDPEIRDTVRSAIAAMKRLGAEVMDVRVADFDSLITGSSVLNMETRQDLIDFLATVPNAPVSSLGAILSQGLHHEALDARLRVADSVGVRDSVKYSAALAKQQVLRGRFIALLDSLNLDVLVYPTMQRKPALLGEPQPGGTCQLSAHSGLPALSAPAGFTSDGLPVGIELLGRPFSDVRLVSLAYAFEQSGSRRRAPSTTPRLSAGHGPRPIAFTASVSTHPGSARASFIFDALRNDLTYRLQLVGVPAARVQAVVLRREDGDRLRVIHRLSGPGVLSVTGHVTLSAADRGALADGHLLLSVFASEHGTTPSEVRLALHGPPKR
ncbi:MAG: amidase family protein, partial [Gemmatimonadaceae bacterium]